MERNKVKEAPGKVGNGYVSTPEVSCNKIDASPSTVLHAIMPVQVRVEGGIPGETYAFVDNGSGGCFATERLKEQLGIKGSHTTLKLGTMHGESLVESPPRPYQPSRDRSQRQK